MTSIFKSGAGEIERCLNARSDDGLLQCLLALCRHHGNASTAEALVSGLPLESGRLTPALFERAASRAGFTSRVVFKRAEDIEEALLPAVLLQRDERACLLVGWSDGGNTARVIYPQLNETVVEVPRENLRAADTGTAILARPRFRFDQRAPRNAATQRGHWFWDAIRANTPVYRDVLLAAFFINLFALALPLFTMNVYDRVVPNQAVETLWMLAAGVIVILLADITLRTMRGYFLDLASRRVDVKLSALIMERVWEFAWSKYNRWLSQQRADAVRQMMIDKHGVDPDRIDAIGLGESRPVMSNDTAEGRNANRRVELVLKGSGA
jgi:ATP-binding cassette subfamily C protein LapB